MDKTHEQVMLIGGTALVYSAQVPHAQRQAAADSILYAQLLANKVASSRFDDYERWRTAYQDAYRQLGWIKTSSTHDFMKLGPARCTAPIQPLEAWLRMRSIPRQAVLDAVKATLARSTEHYHHLMRFSAQAQAQHSVIVLEIGLLRHGPALDLCSVAVQIDKPLSLDTLLSPHLLEAEAEINGLSVILDEGRFQHQRKELHDLMKTRDAQDSYCLHPHQQHSGDNHG
nr:hypothetical protein [uncultured Pseudomonas sp.]